MTHLAGLETSVQKTYEWLHEIGMGLGMDDPRCAMSALRATLHALRDHLTTDEIAQLGAQLPLAVRGLYYEGWNPGAKAGRPRGREEFLERIRQETCDHAALWNAEAVAQATLAVLAKHVSPGEMKQVFHQLPAGIRTLWPENLV